MPAPWRVSTITELMDPGPASSGTPSGTIAPEGLCPLALPTDASRGFDIDSAVSNSTRPPPTRKDPSDTPSAPRITGPISAVMISTKAAVPAARIAVCDRSHAVHSLVNER